MTKTCEERLAGVRKVLEEWNKVLGKMYADKSSNKL